MNIFEYIKMKKSTWAILFFCVIITPVFATFIDNSSGGFKTNLSGLQYNIGNCGINQYGLNCDMRSLGDGFIFSNTMAQNFVFETDVIFHSTNESAASLLFGSNNNLNNKNMYVANINPNNGVTRLFKFQYNSVETQAFNLVSEKSVALTNNNSYHLSVTVIGKHIVFRVNGEVVANTADYTSADIYGQNDAFIGNYLGLLSWNANCTYQNLYVTEFNSATSPQLQSLKLNAINGSVEHNIQFNQDQYVYIAHVNSDCNRAEVEFEKSNSTSAQVKMNNNTYTDNIVPLNTGVNNITLVCENNSVQVLYKLIIIKGSETEYYNERFRGQYHYSVRQGWANDPSGLVYFNGEYHLFYQYYYGLSWGGNALGTCS